MKRILLPVLVLFFSFSAAQFRTREVMTNYADFDQQRFSWGYYIGLNYFDLKIHPDDNGIDDNGRYLINVNTKTGFTVGLIGKLRVNDYIDLRLEPAMHFTQREITFNNIQQIINETDDSNFTKQDVIRNVKSTYLDIPILMNIHGDRWQNTRPYLQAGLSLVSNLQSNEKKEQDNKEQIFRMKTNNFSYQLEAGVEIYFKRFKLTPSVRGIFFFNNELVADNPKTPPIWAGAIKSINSRAVVFSLKFE